MTNSTVLNQPVGSLHPRLPAAVTADYLRRLGLDAEPPSAAALARMHRAHVERIPYETFWLHLGRPVGIDPVANAPRLATTTGGGYCYQLNGALAELLAALGYRVTRHAAGVHGPAGPTPDVLGNHVALVVHDLPTDDNPGGDWYVDVGLGDVLHEPLPLRPGRFQQGPMEFVLERSDAAVGDWHLDNRTADSLAGVSITAPAVDMAHFASWHRVHTTSPESGFRRTVTCQRRHIAGRDVLRGRVLTQHTGDASSVTTIDSLAELTTALADVFAMRLDASLPRQRRLWRDMSLAHDAWLAERSVAA